MNLWQELRWGLLELFFPQDRRCPLCRRNLSPGEIICPGCQSSLMDREEQSGYCVRCSRRLENPNCCPDCQESPPAFIWARAAGPYDGPLRQVIHRFKYSGQRRLADPLGYLLHLALERTAKELPHMPPSFDLVVPVPLHPRRLAQRSFNQAELLALKLAALSGLTVAPEALVRIRETPSQVGLNRKERMANLIGAFAPGNSRVRVEGGHILLIDDIFTTGATVGECSRVLLTAGAQAVYVLTVATRQSGRKT